MLNLADVRIESLLVGRRTDIEMLQNKRSDPSRSISYAQAQIETKREEIERAEHEVSKALAN